MKASWIRITTLLLAAGLVLPLRAQISMAGDDPARVRWNTLRTRHYRLLYAAGSDSLARVYGHLLEKWHSATGVSVGYRPGEKYRKVSPVILHPCMARSNGSVALAPRRMDLYTVYDASNPDPLPWELNLAIHEGRHLAQLQFGRDGVFNGFHYVFGEMFAGALSGVYPSLHLLEGDAVAAETALTASGRGRTHDFLAWYRMASDQGEKRDWYQWRYGSFNRFTPDHYTLGYLTVAGMRVFYDDPLFTQRYFQSVTSRPLRLGHLQKTMRERSGKGFQDTWDDILAQQHALWAAEDVLRGPFTDETPRVKTCRRYEDYAALIPAENGLLAVKTSLFNPTVLVRIGPDGKETPVRPFSGSISKLASDGERIYWSEIVPAPRWTLEQDSRIRFIQDGTLVDLTRKGRFYNPSLSDDGQTLAATEYPLEGGSRIALFSHAGTLLRTLDMPDTLQVVETLWDGDALVFSAVSPAGMGLYSLPSAGGSIETMLDAKPVKINHLRARDGNATFTSDRNGMNNIYRFDLRGRRLFQLTESRYGATDATLTADGLSYTALTPQGRKPVLTPADKLLQREVAWAERHRYPVADALSAQEAALGAKAIEPEEAGPAEAYCKGAHLFTFHSWAPISFDYDDIADVSFESTVRKAAPGVTGLFQNDLGTHYGTASLAYGKGDDGWRPSVHIKSTYSGWYPVFTFSLEGGERLARKAMQRKYLDTKGNTAAKGAAIHKLDDPVIYASVESYIPWGTTSGGWRRGFIPRVKFSWTNDQYSSLTETYQEIPNPDPTAPKEYKYVSTEPNGITHSVFLMDFSGRAYVMRPTAERAVYPKFGFGIEGGYRMAANLLFAYAPTFYLFTYGYLPGFGPGQGLRLSGLWQHKNREYTLYSSNAVKTQPRGFVDSDLTTLLGMYGPEQCKVSADYAIPFLRLDCSWLSPVAYIRNLELIPFADLSLIRFTEGLRAGTVEAGEWGNLWSVGADFNVKLGNFFWLPYDSTLGVRFAYNGGSSYNFLETAHTDGLSRTYVGLQFNVAL